MSERDQWKLLHLLHCYGTPGVPKAALHAAGIDCYADTLMPLLQAGAVTEDGGAFALAPTAAHLLSHFTLGDKTWPSVDMEVDAPAALVIMPFSEPWSTSVYQLFIKPAVEEAGLSCTRGDEVPRRGSLMNNLWDAVLRAGVVIADISVPNPNVFYEMGLAHAIGKEAFVLRQAGSPVPADFNGAHRVEYDTADLASPRRQLASMLGQWSQDVRAQGVAALKDAARRAGGAP